MIIINKQYLANIASIRWDEQYSTSNDPNKVKIGNRLRALGYMPNPEDVDRVIGNSSWTQMTCEECCKCITPFVIRLGINAYNEDDDDVFDICPQCLSTATEMGER